MDSGREPPNTHNSWKIWTKRFHTIWGLEVALRGGAGRSHRCHMLDHQPDVAWGQRAGSGRTAGPRQEEEGQTGPGITPSPRSPEAAGPALCHCTHWAQDWERLQQDLRPLAATLHRGGSPQASGDACRGCLPHWTGAWPQRPSMLSLPVPT